MSRPAVRVLVAAVLVVVVLAAPAVVLADGRVALVAGHSTYDHIGRLANAESDAPGGMDHESTLTLRKGGLMVPFDVLTPREREAVRYARGLGFFMLFLVLLVGSAYLLRLVAVLAGGFGSALVAVAILAVLSVVGRAVRRS